MCSRLLTLLLIACVLAGQWARAPHTHSGMGIDEQSEHDATPHIHLAIGDHTQHSHAHPHSHSPDDSQAPVPTLADFPPQSHGLVIAVDISPATKPINTLEVEQYPSVVWVDLLANEDP